MLYRYSNKTPILSLLLNSSKITLKTCLKKAVNLLFFPAEEMMITKYGWRHFQWNTRRAFQRAWHETSFVNLQSTVDYVAVNVFVQRWCSHKYSVIIMKIPMIFLFYPLVDDETMVGFVLWELKRLLNRPWPYQSINRQSVWCIKAIVYASFIHINKWHHVSIGPCQEVFQLSLWDLVSLSGSWKQ